MDPSGSGVTPASWFPPPGVAVSLGQSFDLPSWTGAGAETTPEATEAESEARREAEALRSATAGLEEAQASSGSAPADEDLVTRLVRMLEEKDRRQDALVSTLVSRLDRLELNQRSPFLAVPPPPPPQGPLGSVQPGGVLPGAEGKSMDTRWIPNMPLPKTNEWKGRIEEIRGFWTWYESFVSWLALIHTSFPAEMKESIEAVATIGPTMLNADQKARSQRLLHLLKTCFQSNGRVTNLTKHLELHEKELTGFELLRQIRLEFSLKTRSEALSLRAEVLKATFKNDNLMDLLRQIESKLLEFQQLLRFQIQLWCVTWPFPSPMSTC